MPTVEAGPEHEDGGGPEAPEEVKQDFEAELQLRHGSPQAEPESDLENQSGFEPESDPEPRPEHPLKPRSESQQEPEPDVDPEPVADSKPQLESNHKFEFEALSSFQPEPQPGTQVEIQTETQFGSEPQQLGTKLSDGVDIDSDVDSNSIGDSDVVTVIDASSNHGNGSGFTAFPDPPTTSDDDDDVLSAADTTPGSNPYGGDAVGVDIPAEGDMTTDSVEVAGLDEVSALNTTESPRIADIVEGSRVDFIGISHRDEDYLNRDIDPIEDTTVEATPVPTAPSTHGDKSDAVDAVRDCDIDSGGALDLEEADDVDSPSDSVPVGLIAWPALYSDTESPNVIDTVLEANSDTHILYPDPITDVDSNANATQGAGPIEDPRVPATAPERDITIPHNHNPKTNPVIDKCAHSLAKHPPRFYIGFIRAAEENKVDRPESTRDQGGGQNRNQDKDAEVKEENSTRNEEAELNPYGKQRPAEVIGTELRLKQKRKLEEAVPGRHDLERGIKPTIGRKRSLDVEPNLDSRGEQDKGRKAESIRRPIAKPKRHIPDAIYASAMKQSRLFADIQQEIAELYQSPRTNNQSTNSKHSYNKSDSKVSIYGTRSSKHYGGGEKGSHEDGFYDVGDVKDICPACQTHYSQALDSVPFRTSLKLRHNNPWSQTWGLGDGYILTETSEDNQPELSEHVTLAEVARLLTDNTRVPVPLVLAAWKEADGKVITITEKPPGRRLFDVWWELTDMERKELAREVGGYVEQWRWNYSDAISGVGGGPVHGRQKLLGGADDDTLRSRWRSGGGGFPPCFSDAGFWGVIEGRLRRGRNKNEIDEKIIQFLNEWMPESYPCRLTHGDLSTRNIMVEIGNSDNYGDRPSRRKVSVTAILGFENAASLPTWAEGVCNRFCYCREDEQWKEMLSRHIPSDPLAFAWWRLWVEVENKTARPDPTRLRMLKERCRIWPKPPAAKRPFVTSRIQRPQVPEMPLQGSAKAPADADLRATADSPRVDTYTEIEGYGPEEADVDPRPLVHSTEPISFWDTDPVASGDESDDVCINGLEDSAEKVIDADNFTDEGQKGQPPLVRDIELEKQKFEEVQEQLGAQLARLRGRYNTWYARRAAEGTETLGNVVDSNELQQSETQESHPHPEHVSKGSHGPLSMTAESEIEQHTRGRSKDRKSPEVRSSASSRRRTPMRSFTQKTLQPLTLRTLPRPKSSPAISASDMEKLRNTGEDERGDIPELQLSGKEEEEQTNVDVFHPNDSLPTIQETPATPRRPVPPVKRGNRPASLYGALYAMGQRQRGTLSATIAENGQGHRRSHSDFNLRPGNPPERDKPHLETRALSMEPPRTHGGA